MNILLLDQPLSNRGDESAYKGLVRNMVKSIPNVQINVLQLRGIGLANAIKEFDLNIPQAKFVNIELEDRKKFTVFISRAYRYHVDWMIRFHPMTRILSQLYDKADLIMFSPGGINLGGFQDWIHLHLMLWAKRKNKRLAYYGRSIGPFLDETWRERRFHKLAKEALNYCEFVCLRDMKSVTLAKKMNVNCVETVDSAFLDSTAVQIPQEIQNELGDKPYITFVPNELIWHYAFRGKVNKSNIDEFYIQLFNLIQKRYADYKIVMLPQLNNQQRNDIDYFLELRKHVKNNKNVVIVPDSFNSDVQQAIIKRAALMVGARYHSIVFAINQGIPFVSLSYEHKMSGLLEILGQSDRMIDITQIFNDSTNMKNAISKFDNLISSLNVVQESQKKAKQIANNCFEQFLGFIKNNF